MLAFVSKHRGIWPLKMTCEALGVSRSGFYCWLSRPPSDRMRRHEVILIASRDSFVSS
jgi:putative transposase